MNDGLSFRDRVAMATPGPGLEEVRTLLGLPSDTPLQPDHPTNPTTAPGTTVRERWAGLTNEERWAYVWKFRYMSADAAVAAERELRDRRYNEIRKGSAEVIQ